MITCDRCKAPTRDYFDVLRFDDGTVIDLCNSCNDLYMQGLNTIDDEIKSLKNQRRTNWIQEFLSNSK